MIVWSQQHSIISSVSLSFEKLEKIHPKKSGSIMERDKTFLNPKKYESFILSDFKFLVLYTVFKRSTNKIDTMKLLQNYTKEDIKKILKEKEKMILYENTFQNDLDNLRDKILTLKNIIKMFSENLISPLYVYWYFKQYTPEGRIQKRTVERVNFYMSYFPKIKEYIDTNLL